MTPLKIFRFNISYFLHLLRWNSLRGAKKNIRAHYDMGNNFFSEWLDKKMQYSSAHFDKNHTTLDQAQENKFKKIYGAKVWKNAQEEINDNDLLELETQVKEIDKNDVPYTNSDKYKKMFEENENAV